MERLTAGILRRSSDAVVIIGLAEGTVVDVNEAFFTTTGHARHELVGRPAGDVLVGLGEETDPTAGRARHDLGSIPEIPVGLWTRSGELRIGDLKALVLEVEGQRNALATIRGVREPTLEQRRSVALRELDRIVSDSDPRPTAAPRALRAFGSCLRWEFGALWKGVPPLERLRCASVWHSLQSELGPLEESARFAAAPSTGMEALRRVWLRAEPVWVPDAQADPDLSRVQPGVGEPMRGWLGFPALAAGGVIGVVEFVSRETRQPDPELLGMIEDFGHRFGRLLGDLEAPDGLVEDDVRRPPTTRRSPEVVPDALGDLAGALAQASEALERHPALAQVQPAALLGELTAGIGRLNQLLEQALGTGASTPPMVDPPPLPGGPDEPPPPVPAGLTLKAVSRRTGIPAATLRTWEHRYEFLRPRRSSAGHRLYGEIEIARIERVKYLIGQGVRVGAAMQAVIEEARDDPDVDDRRSGDPNRLEGKARHAEVYRLAPRPSHGPSGSGHGLDEDLERRKNERP